MQQKGRTEQILDRLKEMVNNGQSALTPGKVSLPKEELNRLILELGLTMENELKQYREITDKRAKVLREAKKQADDIIYEAEQGASRIRISGRKTSVAPLRMMDLEESERRSLDSANEIYAASLIYTDEMMAEMQDVIADAYEKITESYERTITDLKEKSEIIAANRRELMEDLKEMEKEDRYQQIMEIGQLLSEELYYARKHAMGEEIAEAVPENYEQPIEAPTQEPAAVPESYEEPAEAFKQEPAAVPESYEEPAEASKPEPAAVTESYEEPAEASKPESAAVPESYEEPAEVSKPEPAAIPESYEEPAEASKPEPAAVPEDDVRPVKEVRSESIAPSVGRAPMQKDVIKDAPVPIITMDPDMQRDVAAAVASALEDKKKVEVEVAEITEEVVSKAVKKDPQPSLSTSVLEAMKRAAKKAVMGMDEEDDDMLFGEPDEEDDGDRLVKDYASIRTPTQPLDTKAVNEKIKNSQMTPEQIKEEKHRAFVEAHEEKVRAEEAKWLNAVYDPVIPDANAIDPIVAMALKEKKEAKNQNTSNGENQGF